MASGSLFSESPTKADKALARAVERSLSGGDIGPALDALGEAPGLIYERDLARAALDKLADQLAAEQMASPSDQAAVLVAIAKKDPSLEKRLSFDIRQRLARRLRRWQTGPGAARQLACDIYEAALVDMVASQFMATPKKIETTLGQDNAAALGKEMRKRKILKGQATVADSLERWDWITIVDDLSGATDKRRFSDDLYQGIRRFYELPERERIVIDFDVAEEDPDWQAS